MSYKDKTKLTYFSRTNTSSGMIHSIECTLFVLSLIKKTGYDINIFSNDEIIVNFLNSKFSLYQNEIKEAVQVRDDRILLGKALFRGC